MTYEELLAKIEELENNPCPDKEDWFELLYNNLDLIKGALRDAS